MKRVNEKSFARVITLNHRVIEKFFQQHNLRIFLTHSSSKESEKGLHEFTEAAKQLRNGKVIFAHSHPNDSHGHYQRLAEYLGFNVAKISSVILIHTGRDISRYKFNEQIMNSATVEFFKNICKKFIRKKYLKKWQTVIKKIRTNSFIV